MLHLLQILVFLLAHWLDTQMQCGDLLTVELKTVCYPALLMELFGYGIHQKANHVLAPIMVTRVSSPITCFYSSHRHFNHCISLVCLYTSLF